MSFQFAGGETGCVKAAQTLAAELALTEEFLAYAVLLIALLPSPALYLKEA